MENKNSRWIVVCSTKSGKRWEKGFSKASDANVYANVTGDKYRCRTETFRVENGHRVGVLVARD